GLGSRRKLFGFHHGKNPLHHPGTIGVAGGRPVLGFFDGRSYEMGSAQLFAGDRVILFTDGVTEAGNTAGEEFGEARLLRLLEDHRHLSADELQAKILAAVAEFSGGRWQDDATLVVLAVCE